METIQCYVTYMTNENIKSIVMKQVSIKKD